MAIVELIIPKMGESIIEATIITWLKSEGDQIEEDDTILEIATDKVDSEVPSPYRGKLVKILHQPNEVVAVGQAVAHIEVEEGSHKEEIVVPTGTNTAESITVTPSSEVTQEIKQPVKAIKKLKTTRFYTPLVRTIAKTEEISIDDLERIPGTGPKNRLTKEDLFNYVNNRNKSNISHPKVLIQPAKNQNINAISAKENTTDLHKDKLPSQSDNEEIIELDRMRKYIANHMIESKKTSAHVSSFLEADVTHMVHWRNSVKDDFYQKHGEKLTFSPLFTEAVVKALKDFPKINATVKGDHMIVKKNLNLGIATALPNGNLIVPVIRNCEDLSLLGLAKKLNDLTSRARENRLLPEEIQGGTFTISNIGTFGNLMGTPIINQPQLAILALGAIKKKPVIKETDHGDIIAIRHMMFLSLSFDHRVIDGYLGGSFLKRIADHIENFDTNREI